MFKAMLSFIVFVGSLYITACAAENMIGTHSSQDAQQQQDVQDSGGDRVVGESCPKGMNECVEKRIQALIKEAKTLAMPYAKHAALQDKKKDACKYFLGQMEPPAQIARWGNPFAAPFNDWKSILYEIDRALDPNNEFATEASRKEILDKADKIVYETADYYDEIVQMLAFIRKC